MAASTTTRKTPSRTKMSKKRKLADLSVDEFFMNSDTEDTSSEASFSEQPPPSKVKKTRKTSAETGDIKQKPTLSKGKKKKNPLKNLQEDDPEFYEFLLNEDKELLEEDDDDDEEEEGDDSSDDEDVESDDSDDDDEDDDREERFQPPSKLEVASDDDEDEDDSGSDGEVPKTKKKLITSAMIKSWRQQAQESPRAELLQQWIAALAAAAQHAGMSVEASTQFRVDTNAAFNAVMRLCLTDVVPLLERLLTLRSLTEQQQPFSKKNKKWKAVRGSVKTYCVMMLQLSGEFSESSVVNVVLKHIHKMVVCYTAFPKLTKAFLKRMVKLWSTGEEQGRVLAFLCLNKLVRLQPDTLLDTALKQMYMAYVNNCKFVSPTSLPLILFMQRSLVEVFLVQESLAYQHAFVYIRQLAIHLRNAITLKKKEMCQLVYNWQYILSLGLWTQLLSTAHPSPVLQPLVFPLVQVIIGTIRLLPTAQYYPLRFHCVRYLTVLCDTAFIPVLPFLLEVLEQTDFNKKLKGGALKTISMSTILKFSKPQLQEKVFKEAVIEQLCELLLEYLSSRSHHTAGFPELIVPLVVQLKDFTKKCKVAALCRPVKEVLEKAEETAKFVEARRRVTTFNLADAKAVELWESKAKEEGTPVSKFYKSWRKMKDRQRQKEMAAKDQMTTAGERAVPVMKRPPAGPPTASVEDRQQLGDLFGSDDEEEEDDTFRFLPKEDRQKKREPDGLDSDEDYSDFDSDDLEQLAKSASEDDESDDDDDSNEDEEEEEDKKKPQTPHRPKGQKAKKQTSAKQQRTKSKQKLHVENDRGDTVEDFSMSDSD